ncbi:MAG UNVERIFIED_CONTAM: hypothetical protein LVR18_40815 [Planctomycetaceae bacterium]|jgi:hypothetical protein
MRCRDLHHQPTNHRPLEHHVLAFLLIPHPKLLLGVWAQAELDLKPSTGGRAIQVGLEQVKRVFPAESINPIDL